jgi:geranylgeranyl pyrophosphate synthase
MNPSTSINFLAPVQNQLQRVEEVMRLQADERKHPDLYAALQHLLASGGKRVRPALALLVAGMLAADSPRHARSDSASDRLIRLSAAIELLHTATLVHDDLIDGALLRRGIATLNAQWSPAATVLTGDFIFAQAARLAAQTRSNEVVQLFSETLATIVSGELTQLFAGRGIASRENYIQRIYAKTASLFELAAKAPALLAGITDEDVEALRCFGYSLGMAFQIVDDILDFTGEQATVGKPVASDLRQGLVTLPALYYLEDSPDDPVLLALLNGEFVPEVEINRLVQAIRRSGAIEESMEEASEYIEEGLISLSDFPAGLHRLALESLAEYIVNRKF